MRGVHETNDRRVDDGPVQHVETTLDTGHGSFRLLSFRARNGVEHLAVVKGLLAGVPRSRAPLVRVHVECLAGDVLGSRRCDCGAQLDAALGRIAAVGEGVVVYLRGGGDVGQSARILTDLGLSRIRLMSSDPAEEEALTALGIEVVERVDVVAALRQEKERSRATTRARMGRNRPDRDAWAALLEGRMPDHGADGEERELVERYGDLACCGPRVVVAQLGQSLDGFIASRTGDAVFVTGEADREHLHRIRALVDAVVVGAGTVIADDCRLTVRAVAGEHPVRVVLDPNGRIPLSSHVLTDGVAPTLWLVGERARTAGLVPAAAHLAARVDIATVPVGAHGRVEPGVVLALLRERGLGRVLIEGGGRTVSGFFEADVLDRLYLTTAPVLIGDGVPGLRFTGPDRLADALRAPARRFLLGEDTCTELLLR